jgi:hypothetical protein
VTLDDADIDRIAKATADRLSETLVAGWQARYVDTGTIARLLGCSSEWVRDHAAELGAVRLGDGPRGALRFQPDRARAGYERRRLRTANGEAQGRRPGPKPRPRDVHLIPLPDQKEVA